MIISAENIRKELKNYFIYLHLMTSLSTEKYNVIKNLELKKQLHDTFDIIQKMDYNLLLNKGSSIKQNFKLLADYFLNRYPIKKTIDDIAYEFNELFLNGKNPFRTGIELGWLSSVMDLSAKNWPKDLPYQTKIGLGHHAGHASIEDDFLLRDSFYTFLKAEEAYKNLLKLKDELIDNNEVLKLNFDNDSYSKLSYLKFNVSAYSRLSIISFYSFIECFVNTVGFDFYLRNKDRLNAKETEILKGKNNERYLQLEYKIEKFPSIIRRDKKQIIYIKDTKQAKDPFKTLFQKYKNLRDSSVHYSPLKEEIWYSPIDWITRAIEFKKLSVNSAMLFWKACYPNSDGPEYLGKLEEKIQIELAEKRLKIDNEMQQNFS